MFGEPKLCGHPHHRHPRPRHLLGDRQRDPVRAALVDRVVLRLRPDDPRQPHPHQLAVDPVARAAAQDQREAPPGEPVPAGRVAVAAGAAVGVVGRVGVPVAVHLGHQPDVDGLAGLGDVGRHVGHVAVVLAQGDLARGDHLDPLAGRGREAEHAAGVGLAPAVERPGGQRHAPVKEVLEHRRVGADLVGEGAEVGDLAGVGDAVEGPPVARRVRLRRSRSAPPPAPARMRAGRLPA